MATVYYDVSGNVFSGGSAASFSDAIVRVRFDLGAAVAFSRVRITATQDPEWGASSTGYRIWAGSVDNVESAALLATHYESDNFWNGIEREIEVDGNARYVWVEAGESGSYPCGISVASIIVGEVSEPPPDGQSCTYALSPPSASVSYEAGAGSLSVTTNLPTCAWTAASDAPWLQITSGASGTGSGTIEYAYDENATTAQRQATIVAAGQTFTLTQDPFPQHICQFSLTPPMLQFPAVGGVGGFAVSTNYDRCAWTPVSSVDWVHVTAGAGPGNGQVTYVVDANATGAFREGKVWVAGLAHTVRQQADTPPPTGIVLEFDPDTVPCEGGGVGAAVRGFLVYAPGEAPPAGGTAQISAFIEDELGSVGLPDFWARFVGGDPSGVLAVQTRPVAASIRRSPQTGAPLEEVRSVSGAFTLAVEGNVGGGDRIVVVHVAIDFGYRLLTGYFPLRQLGGCAGPGAPRWSGVCENGRVSLSWVAVTDASLYRVERSDDGATWTPVGEMAETELVDSPVTVGRTYSYRIVATVDGEASAPGAAVAVTPCYAGSNLDAPALCCRPWAAYRNRGCGEQG